jgi:hypothetical protein
MMQIGMQPLSAAFAEGPLPRPDEATSGSPGRESQLVSDPAGAAGDDLLFVSPPPLPFPRVFPGL